MVASFLPSATRASSPFAPTPEPWSTLSQSSDDVLVFKPIPRQSGKHGADNCVSFSERTVELAKCCHGSRVLQDEVNKMRLTGDKIRLNELAYQILDSQAVMDLTFDKFGNYFIQTLISGLSHQLLNKFVDEYVAIPAVFARLAVHSFGSHVVQLVISMCGNNKVSSGKLVDCLSRNLLQIGCDFLGSLCLLHAIESLPTSSKLISAIAPYTCELALSRHGHTVLIRALEKGCSQTLGVIEKELSTNIEELIANDYGFRVLVRSLELEKEGKVSCKHSRVLLYTKHIQFKFSYFRLINYLALNFPNHSAIQTLLLPKMIEIVEREKLPTSCA